MSGKTPQPLISDLKATTLRKMTTSAGEDTEQVLLSKLRVKETLASLKTINRKILEANGIKERADDFVYLTIRME